MASLRSFFFLGGMTVAQMPGFHLDQDRIRVQMKSAAKMENRMVKLLVGKGLFRVASRTEQNILPSCPSGQNETFCPGRISLGKLFDKSGLFQQFQVAVQACAVNARIANPDMRQKTLRRKRPAGLQDDVENLLPDSGETLSLLGQEGMKEFMLFFHCDTESYSVAESSGEATPTSLAALPSLYSLKKQQ